MYPLSDIIITYILPAKMQSKYPVHLYININYRISTSDSTEFCTLPLLHTYTFLMNSR